MISDGVNKIAARSLSTSTFLDELPLNWLEYQTDGARRHMIRKSFRIINREHLVNSYPEE